MTTDTRREPETITGTYLALKWSASRGRDTYGDNICTLTDQETGKRFRCNGGGYDMVGTVLGEWLEDRYQGRLQALAAETGTTPAGVRAQLDGFYGLYVTDDGRVYADGACGLDSMTRVARAIGLAFDRTYKPSGRSRGETTGWLVQAAE